MECTVKMISTLEKQLHPELPEISGEQMILPGERFSFQLMLNSTDPAVYSVQLQGQLADSVRLYRVRDGVLDTPMVVPVSEEDDYLVRTPCLMPDILVPLEQDGLYTDKVPISLWVQLDIPRTLKPGQYRLELGLTCKAVLDDSVQQITKTVEFTVLPVCIPEQRLIYTRWIYLDCIATVHGVEIFSEQHWQLIDQYVEAAAELGINMLMVPVHTPPLDTQIGTARPCVQLVDIEKKGDTYTFGFEKFHRYIRICKGHGIRYFEIAHMFTQWGAKATPNILVTENGVSSYQFGWHVASDDPAYRDFLRQYIAAIYEQLQLAEIQDVTYFHISDEPSLENMQTYQAAAQLIRPLIGNCKTLDALSDYDFYEKGLVQCPVTIINKIHDFLGHAVPEQWLYYCCGPTEVYCNGFMALPSYRIRILGFLLYRYGIKGFLHWGFNFYNACRSLYAIDPYLTTSADGAFPSGDPFLVYPGKNGVYPSIRGQLFREGIGDMDLCYAVEEKLGRDAVIALIDETAGQPLRFDAYPKDNAFLLQLRQKLLSCLKD